MRALDSSAGTPFKDAEQLCGGDTFASAIAMARTHPHIPRRRKTRSPQRASGGSACPSAALRSASYWATTRDDPSEPVPASDVIAEFFLGALSRSSSGVHRARISGGSASLVRALEWARPRQGAVG